MRTPFLSKALPTARTAVLLGWFIFPACVNATLLDWDTITTSPSAPAAGSSTSISYNSDPNHAGNDVTVKLANAVGNWGAGYPVVSINNYNGGLTTQKSLAFNFTTETSTTQGLTVTLDFSSYAGGVKNVSFQIFDVDFDSSASKWIDNIDQIWATTAVGATIIGPDSVTGSSYNTVAGSGTGFSVTGVTGNAGAGSALGNVSISFGNTNVTQVQFRWRNVDTSLGDQKIALGDVNYTPTPEVGTSLGAALTCVLALGHRQLVVFLKRPRRAHLLSQAAKRKASVF